MLIRWIARPDACDECKQIAAGSPYERLPTWPGLGDTACDCRCSVEGTRAGKVMAMAGEPMPAPAPITVESTPTAVATPPPPRAVMSAPAQSAVIDAAPLPARSAARLPSLPSLTSFRVKPLERRWAFALGALIFLAAFVALFSTH